VNRVIRPRPHSLKEIVRSAASFGSWHALRTHYLAQRDWTKSRAAGRAEAFGEPLPWWSYSCTTFLDQVVAPSAKILEFGSGGSTLWWLGRECEVTSLESSVEWAEEVRERAGSRVEKLAIHVCDLDDNPLLMPILSGAEFDVIVVDHSGDRVAAVSMSQEYLAPGGMIILDNSDRPEYEPALRLLAKAGFSQVDFHGLGPINAFSSTTSVFVKGASIPVSGRAVHHTTVPN